ncbi:MAG: hypothetical protein IPK53_08175 [bacterium]|nr:hypothetical protein [bacterium]
MTIEQLINSANYYYEAIQEVVYWEEVVVQEFETDPYFQEESYEAQVDPAISEQANQQGYQVLLNTAAGARASGNGAAQYFPRLRSPVIADETTTTVVKTYSFDVFYHPHVRQFIKYLNRDGVPGLLQRRLQLEGPLKFSIKHTVDLLNWDDLLNWLDDDTNKEIPEELETIFTNNRQTLPPDAKKFVGDEWQKWEIRNKKEEALFLLIKNGGLLDVYDCDELFEFVYDPKPNVNRPYPLSNVDFRFSGAYAVYNWELFFHIPLLIANLLCQNQRFDEALKWYHYIFDPTDISNHSDLERFWQTKPFFKQALSDPIQDLLNLLNQGDQDMLEQVAVWHENPFRPHAVARLRIAAYQKNVVMKYIDNLLAWGDQLFRRDTIESINQATLLYVLAARLLGRKPEEIASEVEIPVHSFEQLNLDAFANALVQVEEALQPSTYIPGIIKNKMGGTFALGPAMYLGCANGDCGPAAKGEVLYFCIPKNTGLLSYWEKVADRLFKIRHCMNIEGIVRQLPIFETPIDPGILVRAVAAGVDISSVLNDMYAPLPHYRFQVVVQKAIELCSDVKALGAALLSVLEKRDAEAISLLRSSHEVQLLNKTKEVKKKQIDEALENIASLEQSAILTTLRSDYYQDLLGLEGKPAAGSLPSIGMPKLLPKESAQMDHLKSARKNKFDAAGYELLAKVYDAYPDITLGTSGAYSTPVATAQIGGSLYAAIARAVAAHYSTEADRDSEMATMDGLRSGHERNAQGWSLQLALAQQEAEQIAKQTEAAKIRLAINKHELEIHDLQTEHAVEVDEYLRHKFSNKELYNWMVSQTSSIFFQSYQLAYDMAKQAEKAFQYELGVTDTDFIRFGYWDSLKKGLLAGERLHYDLKRMEAAYLKQNRREYELTQHISLAQLNPIALIKFRETGSCFFDIPETVFDLNHPGHYMRRIKSVSLTIPCVTGPYTSLSCELTLQSNRIRKNTSTNGGYAWNDDSNDDRFLYNVGGLQSIATSSGNNDSGLFDLSFRDERYLPFEGAGAISSWHLELPGTFRQFNYDTISDVILHVRYTAQWRRRFPRQG